MLPLLLLDNENDMSTVVFHGCCQTLVGRHQGVLNGGIGPRALLQPRCAAINQSTTEAFDSPVSS